MARDGSGNYSLPATMATASAVASSVTVNSIMDDVAQALTDSINKDGTKAFAAAQSMGGNRLTSLAAATALTDAAQLSQVQKGNVSRAITVAGTVDAITLMFNPTITSYTTGMKIRWVSGGANTIAGATVNVDGLGAITLKKNPASAALVAGDLGASGTIIEAEYNGTNFIVLNPVTTLGALAALNTVGTSQIDDNSVTGAKIALGSDAQGDVMYYDGTNWVRLGAGTSGQFLKTNGAGANPAWADTVAGGMTLLSTLTTTSGSTQTASGLTLTSYIALYIVVNSVSSTTSYGLNMAGVQVSGTGISAGSGAIGSIWVDLTTGYMTNVCTFSTGGGLPFTTAANVSITTATTSIAFTTSAGTFDAGSIKIYGVK